MNQMDANVNEVAENPGKREKYFKFKITKFDIFFLQDIHCIHIKWFPKLINNLLDWSCNNNFRIISIVSLKVAIYTNK